MAFFSAHKSGYLMDCMVTIHSVAYFKSSISIIVNLVKSPHLPIAHI